MLKLAPLEKMRLRKLLILWALTVIVYFATTPVFTDGKFELLNNNAITTINIENPDYTHSGDWGRCSFKVRPRWEWAKFLQPVKFKIHTNLDEETRIVKINGSKLPLKGLDATAWKHTTWTLTLENLVGGEISIEGDRMETIWIEPAQTDKTRILLYFLQACSVLLSIQCIAGAKWAANLLNPAVALYGAAILRLLYFWKTTLFERSYDFGLHTEVIQFILDNGRMPNPGEKIEAWQPPLYYEAMASLSKLLKWAGATEMDSELAWQAASFLFGIAGIVILYKTAKLCFPNKNAEQALMLAGASSVPTLALFTTNVSNDTLFTLLSTLWLFFVVKYWMAIPSGKSERDSPQIVFASITGGIGMAVKASMIPLIGSAGIVMLIKNKGKLPLKPTLVCLLCLLATGGVFIMGRVQQIRNFGDPKKTYSPSLATSIENSLLNCPNAVELVQLSSEFSPKEMIHDPEEGFGDAGSSERQEMAMECYFKSAFSGENLILHQNYPLLKAIVAINLVLLPLSALGWICAVRYPQNAGAVMLVVFLAVEAAMVSRILRFPATVNFNFRYFAFLSAPIAWSMVEGWSHLPKLLKEPVKWMMLADILLMAALLVIC